MKRIKNGFTFVELLAVIAVLGVIITLATTATVSLLNNSKKRSSKISAKSYVTAVNDYNKISSESERFTTGSPGCTVTGANVIKCKVANVTPKIKNSISGTLPTSGDVYIDLTINKVVSANLKIRGYNVSYTTSNNGNGKYSIDN